MTETILVEIAISEEDYERVFDSECSNWRGGGFLYNCFFLKSRQNYLNNILQMQGYLFLNDVLRALGFPKTSVGAVTGWLNTDDSKAYVDFGIQCDDLESDKQAFQLKFNVQGVIFDKI